MVLKSDKNKEMKNSSRITSLASFGQKKIIGFKKVSNSLFLVLVVVLMSLPLFTTFNEILTKVAEKTGIYKVLTNYVVPFQTRSVALILKPLGVVSSPTNTHLFIERADGSSTGVYLSWNCLGWQSALLLILTLFTGLTGSYPVQNKFEVILLGISGTFLINLVRITFVTIVAFHYGQLAGVLVHDYLGTLFTILWFFFFWWFSYKFVLVN